MNHVPKRTVIIIIFCILLMIEVSPVFGLSIQEKTKTSEKIASFIQNLVVSGKPEEAFREAALLAPQKPSVTTLEISRIDEDTSSEENSSYINRSCLLSEMYLTKDENNTYLMEYSGKYNFTELYQKNKEFYNEIISRYPADSIEAERFANCCAYPKGSF